MYSVLSFILQTKRSHTALINVRDRLKWFDGVVVCLPQVIDEIYRVLRYVNSTRAPQRAHEVLQELRDISSMAMEYFDEKIVPILKKRLPGADLSGRLIGSAPGTTVCFSVDKFLMFLLILIASILFVQLNGS